MADSITIRPASREDLDALAQMYAHHWCNNVPDPSDKLLAGRHCVIVQLVRSSVALVEEQGGSVAGVCMGCVIENGTAPVAADWVDVYEEVHAAACRRAETAYATLEDALFGEERELEMADRFIATGDPLAQAQINLFMVEPRLKGQGLGTRLYEKVLGQLRSAGAHSFFLMSDTESDYAYYEHRGMRCVARYPDDPEDPNSWAALLYGGTLSAP